MPFASAPARHNGQPLFTARPEDDPAALLPSCEPAQDPDVAAFLAAQQDAAVSGIKVNNNSIDLSNVLNLDKLNTTTTYTDKFRKCLQQKKIAEEGGEEKKKKKKGKKGQQKAATQGEEEEKKESEKAQPKRKPSKSVADGQENSPPSKKQRVSARLAVKEAKQYAEPILFETAADDDDYDDDEAMAEDEDDSDDDDEMDDI